MLFMQQTSNSFFFLFFITKQTYELKRYKKGEIKKMCWLITHMVHKVLENKQIGIKRFIYFIDTKSL